MPMTEVLADGDYNQLVSNINQLDELLIGHKIVSVVADESGFGLRITLDNAVAVLMDATSACCAYTEVEAFLLHPELVDHMITGVTTTNDGTTWHVYADLGDILELTVGWSEGSGYYGYGFDIQVKEPYL